MTDLVKIASTSPKRLIRVFPRRTKATPLDDLARSPSKGAILPFPGFLDEADEIHIDVTFTQDTPKAEMLASNGSMSRPLRSAGLLTVTTLWISRQVFTLSRVTPSRRAVARADVGSVRSGSAAAKLRRFRSLTGGIFLTTIYWRALSLTLGRVRDARPSRSAD